MKSYNSFKLLIGAFVASFAFVACSESDTEAIYSTQYVANTSNLKNVGKAVDLGLSSGTKWADINLGASSETDNGLLFVWGDITGTQLLPTANTYKTMAKTEADLFEEYKGEQKTGYLYDTLIVYRGESVENALLDEEAVHAHARQLSDSLVAANPGKTLYMDMLYDNGSYVIEIGQIDSTAVKYYECKTGSNEVKFARVNDLTGKAQVDAATANWGANWAMPSKEQFEELLRECTWEFMGNGYEVTGPSKNKIFLPAAGYRYGEKYVGANQAGYYATGSILATYRFPSMVEQKNGSKGEIIDPESMPNLLIFQCGPFDYSRGIYNNLTTNYAVSIRPVSK